MNRLREIREKSGMTLDELAKLLGVSKQAVNGWEKGSRKIPSKRKSDLAAIFAMQESDFAETQGDNESNNSFPGGVMLEMEMNRENEMIDMQKRIEIYADRIYGEGILNDLKEKKKEQKNIERRIHKNFEGKDAVSVKDQLAYIDRAGKLYGHFNNVVEGLYDIEPGKRALFTYRIMEYLYAMEKAVGQEITIEASDLQKAHGVKETNIDLAYEAFNKAINEAEQNAELCKKNIVADIKRSIEKEN